MYTIYRVCCTKNQKSYVGKTGNARSRRLQHFAQLRRGNHDNRRLQEAYDEYGKEAFFFEILETDLIEPIASQREAYWISKFNSCKDGFNFTDDGEGLLICQKQPCVFNGVHYDSLKDAAKALGVSTTPLSKRLNGILTSAIKSRPFEVACRWNGIEFKSLSEAAKFCGISRSAMSQRLQKGYTCDADMSNIGDSVEGRYKPCVWNGIEYPSIVAAAIANNTTSNRIQKSIKRGRTGDQDIKTNSGKRNCKWNGIEYETMEQAAKANGVTRQTIANRLAKGYTCDNDVTDKWGNKLY